MNVALIGYKHRQTYFMASVNVTYRQTVVYKNRFIDSCVKLMQSMKIDYYSPCQAQRAGTKNKLEETFNSLNKLFMHTTYKSFFQKQT